MRRLIVSLIALVIVGGAALVAAQGMPLLTVMDSIERGQRAMRAQVEQCNTPALPPFVELPNGTHAGQELLVDAWGQGLEVRARWNDYGWRVFGVNPKCGRMR